MTLKPAAPVPDAPTINVALIGPPKSGKSTGAASAPGPVLFVNTDLPNATRYVRRKWGDEHVQEVLFEGIQTTIDVSYEAHNPTTLYKTIVIDSVGDLYRRLLEERSRRAIRPRIEIRGDLSVIIERFLRDLCEAPVNAVFVCHDMPVHDDSTGETTIYPFTGTSNTKLGTKLLGMVDVVGYTGVAHNDSGRHFMAQLTTNKGRPGGDRFDALMDPETGSRELDLSEWLAAIRAAEATQNNTPTEEQETANAV